MRRFSAAKPDYEYPQGEWRGDEVAVGVFPVRPTPLLHYDHARKALAEARRIDEAKEIRDKAIALAAYARQANDRDMICWATEIQVRAERRAGELLTTTRAAGQRQQGGRPRKPSYAQEGLPTLAELGVSENQSSAWQQLAAIPDGEFEAAVAAATADGGRGVAARILMATSRRESERARRADLHAGAALADGFYVGDFRVLAPTMIPDASVPLVLTDPPYDEDSIGLYGDVAAEAARTLRPGGSLLLYAGQKYLARSIAAAEVHLRYWWAFTVLHGGGHQLLEKLGIRCAWKPVLWFVKETRGDVSAVILDKLDVGAREKSDHPWQQAESEARWLIERFTEPGETVLDFCAGSGTVLRAARSLGRIGIGFEIDPQTAAQARLE